MAAAAERIIDAQRAGREGGTPDLHELLLKFYFDVLIDRLFNSVFTMKFLMQFLTCDYDQLL